MIYPDHIGISVEPLSKTFSTKDTHKAIKVVSLVIFGNRIFKESSNIKVPVEDFDKNNSLSHELILKSISKHFKIFEHYMKQMKYV